MDNLDLQMAIIKFVLYGISLGMIITGIIKLKIIYDHYYYGRDIKAKITKITSRRIRRGKRWTYYYEYITEQGVKMNGKFSTYKSWMSTDEAGYKEGHLIDINYLPHKPNKSIYIIYNKKLFSAGLYLIIGIYLLIKIYFTIIKWNSALISIS